MYIQLGEEYLKSKKICFIGLARNIENNITQALDHLVNFGEKAKESLGDLIAA